MPGYRTGIGQRISAALFIVVCQLVLAALLLPSPLAPSAWALGRDADPLPPVAFETTDIELETRSGRHRFTVELAVTPRQRIQGLQQRTALAANAGMLFLFDPPTRVSMWMKDTLISLDMAFVAGDGRIVGIHAGAEPGSEAAIRAPTAVRAVLEVNAGVANRIGLRPGDRLLHPLFQSPGDGPGKTPAE
ncbi:MAG: DUF192 domain-containing protein [Rhodospirillales bacterium]|nr:MAG: DUF192 domain-containing protein [Rhodospirillales bacterium]